MIDVLVPPLSYPWVSRLAIVPRLASKCRRSALHAPRDTDAAHRTAKPPHLRPNHPIRRAFYRLGTLIARHWFASIVFSVAVGVTFCYPSVFLYTNPTAGFTSKIPHHVWASARLFESSLERQPDIEIRQVWVHGSYMKALEPDTLKEALAIQTALIEDRLLASDNEAIPKIKRHGCDSGLNDASAWGFHSPLMYWDCSTALVERDEDLIATINRQAQHKSYMNLTLRPHSVFAGKSFVGGNITAADALVITFIDRIDAAGGARWDKRIRLMAEQTTSHQQWYLPEKDGGSHLYEFEFKPMTFSDAVVLLLCYVFMAAYVLTGLRRTRAVKSTLGLGLTIITELSVSIIASLTICGILNIDLSLIPREVYPFVVFAIGLENMFRIMNAVVGTPATMPTVQRIATALAEVGHLSLLALGQNLFLLWVLSKLVAPSVQAFCAFAAIASLVDFVMHLSFFIAVLSVDVQRLELQDSLDRLHSSKRQAKSPHRPERQTWYEALRQGKLPLSTRVAGTAVTLSFVLALNWHFFDNMSLIQMLQTMRPGTKNAGILFSSATLPPVNARRSPGTWLRMQNQQTAEEVIGFVKPKTPSFMARIHQPVAVVLQGADRGGVTPRTETVLAIIHDVLDAHLIPFALSVISIIALTTILMNYLLWDELSENDGFDGGDGNEEMLSVGRLQRLHEHDVVNIFTSGRLVFSVSSDRSMVLSIWDAKRSEYASHQVQAEATEHPLWPLAAAAIDESGAWLAVYAKDGRVGFCAIGEGRFRHVVQTPLKDRAAILATFAQITSTEHRQPQFLLLTNDGSLTEFTLGHTVSTSSSIMVEETPSSACLIARAKAGPRILVTSRNSSRSILEKQGNHWRNADILTNGEARLGDEPRSGQAVRLVSELDCVMVYRGTTVRILDTSEARTTNTMTLPYPVRRGSLRVLHAPRRTCRKCSSPATHALTLAYINSETNDFIMLTYKLSGDASLLCFAPFDIRQQSGCSSVEDAKSTIRMVENPGAWEATDVQAVIGVRKSPSSQHDESDSDDKAMSTASDIPFTSIRRLSGKASRRPSSARQNQRNETSGPPYGDNALEDWQIWTLAAGGELETRPFSSVPIHSLQGTLAAHREHEQLFAATVGPVRKLGKRGITVALANTVYTVTLSAEGGTLQSGSDEGVDPAAQAQRTWHTRGRERDLASHRRHNE